MCSDAARDVALKPIAETSISDHSRTLDLRAPKLAAPLPRQVCTNAHTKRPRAASGHCHPATGPHCQVVFGPPRPNGLLTAFAGLSKVLIRKGITGDWANHMDKETWAKMDAVAEERLGKLKVWQPLKEFM